MTKLVKKLLISLMAIVMTACCGFAVIGLNKTVVNAESTYDIKILGTALSDSNLTFDTSDNASVSGSITYSPEENKLTLNNFKFNGPNGDHVINVVSSTLKTLTVELIGDSEITITENTLPSSDEVSAFYAKEDGKICFVGGGSFTVDNSAFDSDTGALHASGKDIFVYNSQLVGKGYNTGIFYCDRIIAYGENASILAMATNPEAERSPFNSSDYWIYPALARFGGFMYSKIGGQVVKVSFEIDGSNPSSYANTDERTYASYKYFYIAPVTFTVSTYKPEHIGVYYNFTPSTLCYGEKITVTPEPGYVLTNIQYTLSSYEPKATLQPDGSYVLDTTDAKNTQYDTIKFWATYAEAKTINKTPSVGGDYVVPSAGAYNKTVTITPTPNAGYYTDTVTVTSASGNTIKVTGPNADGAYTFVMPKEEVSVSVDFKQLITYDVWVAGFRLDSRNLTIDRKDNYAITGSAIYDPTSNTLTLDDFSYTGAGYNIGATTYALIYSTGIDLKIVLKGTNKLVGTGDHQLGIIIEDGSLTIAGSDEYSDTASLELTVDDQCIYADGSLSIENAKLTTTTTYLHTGNSSPTQAIFSYGGLSITSSEVTVIAGDSDGDGIIEFGYTQGIISGGTVSITGSSVNVAANAGGIYAESRMTIDNSTVIIDGGTSGTYATATSIKNSTVIISGGIAIETNTKYGGNFIISNSNVEISAQEYAIYDWYNDEPLAYSKLDSTGHAVYAGENKESATLLTEIPEDVFENKYLRFIPAYDVWVAGIRLNAENFIIDNNDDSTIKGSATYDPTSNTLTLDNFKYESIGDYRGNNDYEPIRVKDGTTINVVGSIDIACNALSDDNYYAIYGLGSLTIIGNGDTDILYTHGYDGGGIYSSGTLTIQNLKLAVHANQSAIHSKKEITLDKVSGEINSWLEDGIYVSDFSNSVNILNCNLLIEGYRKGITANYSVVYFENSFVEICSQDGYALWDNDRNAIAYVSYKDKPFVFAGWYEDEAEEVDPYDTNSFKNNYVKIVPTRKVTLNFSSVGLPSEEVFVIVNATAIIETPVIDGYVFIGWYNEDTLETAFDFSTPITENITIYAKFANYTQDMADINSQINGVKDSINSLQSSINDGKADATELANSVTDLQGKINALTNNYQSADATQQVQIDALESQVENLITNAIAVLNGKVANIESEITNINSAISTNTSDITANADKITSLTTQLTALQGLANSLSDTYIDNDELAKLKAELVGVDNQIKGLIETLTAKVTGIESEIANINSAISTNAGAISTNANNITSLTTQLTALQGLANSLSDTYIDNDELSSLKDALELADKGLNDLITALTARVTQTESDIASLVSNKADVTLVTEKVEELKGLINSLDAVKNNYSTADEELKNQLTTAINNAKQQAIDSATELVNTAKSELNAAIALKADTATVTAKFKEVESAIDILQELSDDYVSADSALKEELTTLITDTKEEIIELILAGDKANAEALEKEIAKLREEIGKAGTNAKVLPTVIASGAVLGDIALLVWLIIKRKIVK